MRAAEAARLGCALLALAVCLAPAGVRAAPGAFGNGGSRRSMTGGRPVADGPGARIGVRQENRPLSANAPAAPARTHAGEVLGWSVEGRPIEAYSVGWGSRSVVFVGAIHGGSEWATGDLAARAAEYFRLRAAEIPPALTLVFIPYANPDGLAAGRARAGRFNANQVDLNRNWDCAWQPQSRWNAATVSGGAAPFSEPETRALRDYLLRLRPELVVFYHSQAGTVATGACAPALARSEAAARAAARATGYRYTTEAFYEVSGDAAGYFNQEGLPAIEVELWTHSDMDWAINLAGIRALMQWAAEGAGR